MGLWKSWIWHFSKSHISGLYGPNHPKNLAHAINDFLELSWMLLDQACYCVGSICLGVNLWATRWHCTTNNRQTAQPITQDCLINQLRSVQTFICQNLPNVSKSTSSGIICTVQEFDQLDLFTVCVPVSRLAQHAFYCDVGTVERNMICAVRLVCS